MGNEPMKKVVVPCVAPPVLLRYEAEVNGVRSTVWAGQSTQSGWDRHVRANCVAGDRVFRSVEKSAIEDIVKAFSRFVSAVPVYELRGDEIEFENLAANGELLRRIMRIDPREPTEHTTLGSDETAKVYHEIAVPVEEPLAIWDCKIGEVDRAKLPEGADLPMRRAIEAAYRDLVGEEPNFIFSGWGAALTEGERDVVLGAESGTTRPNPMSDEVSEEFSELDDFTNEARVRFSEPDPISVAETREAMPVPCIKLGTTVTSITKDGEDEGSFFLHGCDNGDALSDGWSMDIGGTMRAGFESSGFLRSLVGELVVAYNDAAYHFDAPLVGLDRAVNMSLAKMLRSRDATPIGEKQAGTVGATVARDVLDERGEPRIASIFESIFGVKPTSISGKANIQMRPRGSSPCIFRIDGGTITELADPEEVARVIEILIGDQSVAGEAKFGVGVAPEPEPATSVAAGDDSQAEAYAEEVRKTVEANEKGSRMFALTVQDAMKETREMVLASSVLTAYTGINLSTHFVDASKYISKVLGRPVFTPELGSSFDFEGIRKKIDERGDFVAACESIRAPSIQIKGHGDDTDNRKLFLAATVLAAYTRFELGIPIERVRRYVSWIYPGARFEDGKPPAETNLALEQIIRERGDLDYAMRSIANIEITSPVKTGSESKAKSDPIAEIERIDRREKREERGE